MKNERCKACGEESKGRKYCHECETKVIFEGFAKWQLFEAFEKVQNPTNWKNPIDVEVSRLRADDQRLIEAAIIFYAGCRPTFTKKGIRTQIKAVGYYAAVGA